MKEQNLQKSEVYLPWLVIVFSITGLLIGRFHGVFGPSLISETEGNLRWMVNEKAECSFT
jgi:hypothetical protein